MIIKCDNQDMPHNMWWDLMNKFKWIINWCCNSRITRLARKFKIVKQIFIKCIWTICLTMVNNRIKEISMTRRWWIISRMLCHHKRETILDKPTTTIQHKVLSNSNKISWWKIGKTFWNHQTNLKTMQKYQLIQLEDNNRKQAITFRWSNSSSKAYRTRTISRIQRCNRPLFSRAPSYQAQVLVANWYLVSNRIIRMLDRTHPWWTHKTLSDKDRCIWDVKVVEQEETITTMEHHHKTVSSCTRVLEVTYLIMVLIYQRSTIVLRQFTKQIPWINMEGATVIWTT